MEPFRKGAEADIFIDGGRLIKERVSKRYRIGELDRRLRRQRTASEARNLERAHEAGVRVPKLISCDEKTFTLEMEAIEGELVKDVFERGARVPELSLEIGAMLKRLHERGIVHNDLTTSNLILTKDGIAIIDFGLAYHTTRLEDYAMDLVVFKKSVQATHTGATDAIWDGLLRGYQPGKELLGRIETIEKRVRYK